MSTEIPYRAAGTFDGRSYVVRDADHDLLLEIERNQRFPYIVAPRQSGKSSLLIRTIKTLDPEEYTCAFIDIAPIVIESYREFWDEFLLGVAKSGKLSRDPLRRQDPEDTFRAWLEQQDTRLVVMVDEIDVLLAATFKEQFFSKIRTFFNNRAIDKTFSRLQFVLAGSARPSTLISDPKRSPFNVGIEVELEELSPDQLVALTAHLRSSGARVSPELPARIFHFTGGSVYLCQLILEHLWSVAIHGKSVIAPDDVDGIVDSIIEHAPRNVHFENLYRLLSGNRELLDSFRRLLDGEEIDDGARLELRLAGISNGLRPFRNELYRRVFSGDGRLSLTRHTRPRAGSRKSSDNGQLKPGDTLGGGTYRLMQKIGQGGFGAVWMALGQRDRRSVAIKVLHAHLAEDKKRRARFFRGARAMAQLDHPSIVHVIEPHGEEGGNYYFVMEYVEGYDFRDAVRRHFLPEDKVLPIIQQVGRALAHAHDRGLIHRDVKPSNILLDASGEPRLTDFDLVRMPDSATTNETQTGAVGSFIYTAPEVTREAKEADAAADVYSLAMTAIFGLYGDDLSMDVVRNARRFIDAELECSEAIKEVLKRAVSWNKQQRYLDAGSFCLALDRAWRDDVRPPPLPPEDSLAAFTIAEDDELVVAARSMAQARISLADRPPSSARAGEREDGRPEDMSEESDIASGGEADAEPVERAPEDAPEDDPDDLLDPLAALTDDDDDAPPLTPAAAVSVAPAPAPTPATTPTPEPSRSRAPTFTPAPEPPLSASPGLPTFSPSRPKQTIQGVRPAIGAPRTGEATLPKRRSEEHVPTAIKEPTGGHRASALTETDADAATARDTTTVEEAPYTEVSTAAAISAATRKSGVSGARAASKSSTHAAAAREKSSHAEDRAERADAGSNRAVYLAIIVVAALVVIWLLLRACGTTPVERPDARPPGASASAPDESKANLPPRPTTAAPDVATTDATPPDLPPPDDTVGAPDLPPSTPDLPPPDPTSGDAPPDLPDDFDDSGDVDGDSADVGDSAGGEPDSNKDEIDALVRRGCNLVKSNNTRAGLDELLKAFDLGGGRNYKLRVCMAQAKLRNGDAKAALTHYREALRSSPRSRAALLGAAQTAERAAAISSGSKTTYTREALRYYRQYNHFHPGNQTVEASIKRLEGR